MSRCFDFALALPGLAGVRFLVCRPSLSVNGDPESGILDDLDDLRRHPPGTALPRALATVLAEPGHRIVAIVRNPALVLDAGLPGRVAAAIASLPAEARWSLAGAGGLGPDDRRHLALYATATPAIPQAGGPHPLIDVMPDLYLLDAGFARTVLAGTTSLPDAALEPVLVTEGYLDGRPALFLPALSAGIDGDLQARDLVRLEAELCAHFATRLAGESIATLAGPVRIAPASPRDAVLPPPAGAPDLAQCVETAILALADPLGLSVVVRTRFDRMHLLRRLLTSLGRARRANVELEIVLSTDTDAGQAAAETETLGRDFCNLAIRLAHNPPGAHSRVGNMLGGIRAARHDYVVLTDDDDYVDLFAFDAVAPALFAGNRPLIVTDSRIHDEVWEETPSGRWVLSRSTPRGSHAATGWRDMFSGVNRLPVSAMLMPRERLLARLDCFAFEHDLSEDYALYLLVLTDPALPAIATIPRTFSHISVRGTENSITMPDRRPWARDIAGFLADLTATPGVAGPGLWQLLTGARGAPVAAECAAMTDLRTALDRTRTDLRLVSHQNTDLRRQLAGKREVRA